MTIRAIALGTSSLMAAALLTAGGSLASPAAAVVPGACGSITTATSPELDTVESRTAPVPHCFLHGTLGNDRDFRILLPVEWNGKYVLGVAGGFGGTENGLFEGTARLLPAGYAYAESNEGRRGTVFDADDTFTELHLTANHQATQYALQKVEELYGAPARRKYLYGFSGGARRALAQLENYPGVYDGANIGSPPAEQSRWTHSVFDRYYPVILPKVNQIIAARDRNEDPMVTAGLSVAEKDALQRLYDAGVARGTEYNLFAQDGATVGLGFPVFTLHDSTYFKDFWTQPGYEGTSGEADSQVAHATGTVTSLSATSPGLQFDALTSRGFAANRAKGYRITFTSGALAGQTVRYHIANNAPKGAASSTSNTFTITGLGGTLNGLSAGDTFTIDNRDFLAWTYYYRHTTNCELPYQQRYCQGGAPIYVQRPARVQQDLSLGDLSGKIRVPIVFQAASADPITRPATLSPVIARIRDFQASEGIDGLRTYWVENGLHATVPPANLITRAVPYSVQAAPLLYGFMVMDRWVDQGITPPDSTVVNVTPQDVTFPRTAAERKGIQPVVHGTANDLADVTVTAGTNVQLNGQAESPIGATLTRYEWDFGDDPGPDYDCAHGTAPNAPTLPGCSGGSLTPASTITTPANYVYATPGTYVATVKVYDNTDALGPFDGIQNLSRIVIRVTP